MNYTVIYAALQKQSTVPNKKGIQEDRDGAPAPESWLWTVNGRWASQVNGLYGKGSDVTANAFQGSALLSPALSPPCRPMPCFIFLFFLSLAVSLWIL